MSAAACFSPGVAIGAARVNEQDGGGIEADSGVDSSR